MEKSFGDNVKNYLNKLIGLVTNWDPMFLITLYHFNWKNWDFEIWKICFQYTFHMIDSRFENFNSKNQTRNVQGKKAIIQKIEPRIIFLQRRKVEFENWMKSLFHVFLLNKASSTYL